jgi:hypothetical protein
MVQSTVGRVINGSDLEGQIQAEVRKTVSIRDGRPINAAPEKVHAPTLAIPDTLAMPEYVQHREGATEIGKLSAEGVVREYEAAAKDIEAMGAELIERVKQCEAMTREALAVTKEMKDTAARYREQAKRIFLQIEECSLITAEVRKTCTELKDKIAAPPTAPA